MARMPVLFVGHGSPMNAIEDNLFSRNWRSLASQLPRPAAILAVSAHWCTEGICLSDADQPETIHDMYGFPRELYQVEYPAPGAPALAATTKALIGAGAEFDRSWGIDHGAWSVLRWMYPEADIPVCQLSIDQSASLASAYEVGRSLKPLREQGVLILGSGNVVHNLALLDWGRADGYAWAQEFDDYIKEAIRARDDERVIQYEQAGPCARQAFVTSEHFAPLLHCIGAAEDDDEITVFNDACVMGSLSMTGYIFG